MTPHVARSFLGGREPDHIGFHVASIEHSVEQWAKLGAGPFFHRTNIRFDEVTFRGDRCTFEHSHAFGCFGNMLIELQEIHSCSPPALARILMPGGAPVMNHVAYVSEDPERDSHDLAAAGFPLFMKAVLGPIEVRFHDARGALGCALEIHRPSDLLAASRTRFRAAAADWDGTARLRA